MTAVVVVPCDDGTNPGTLTSGRTKLGVLGGDAAGCAVWTTWACCRSFTSVSAERPCGSCTTTTDWASESDAPKRWFSTAWAWSAAVLPGINSTNPKPVSAPKSGRMAVAAKQATIQAAMIGSPRYAVTPA